MSDEVSQFLEQVERLRGQQIEEDEVRARELEEYLAAKRERQARRAERARSISPQKSSPANTPSPRSSRQSFRLADAPKLDSPKFDKFDSSSIALSDDSREPSVDTEADPDAMAYSSSPTKENESPADADAKRSGLSTPPARNSLSWQRRPASRGGTRPLSMVAAQNATQRSLAGSQEPQSATETSFSRDQIAQNLGGKDPSWFRQTADRGQDSAAYRKSQVEDEDRTDIASASSQLPGMSDPSKDPSRDRSASQTSTGTPAHGKLASPLPLSAPRFDGPSEESSPPDRHGGTPSGNTSPTRSTSPTKGMGGFVQSAMMKRTDSVKRWSVQSPPGLTRGDSVTSVRSAYDRARPASYVRSGSRTPGSSRPTSQHGDMEASNEETTPKAATAKTPPEINTKHDDEPGSIPTSPSKTMDPRRWSPTKSSWLDSALNKPESPKPQTKPHTPTQPSWMTELNKNKAERSNPRADHGRSGSVSSHKHQVSIGGLMRSTPMGTGVKPNTTDLGGIYSPPARGNRPEFGHASKPSFSRSPTEPNLVKTEEKSPEPTPEEPKGDEQPSETMRRGSVASPSSAKPNPETPAKTDFRANLRQRPADSGPNKQEEPEFKNALGNLRRAKTENYVAPDELKSNILRGKAALNNTGGPKKSEVKDEFKDAILKKKDDFKKVQAEGKGITRAPATPTEKPLPEGLARRAELGRRKDSVTDPKSESPNPVPGLRKGSVVDSMAESPKPGLGPRKGSVADSKAESPKPALGPKRISTQAVSSPKSPAAASPSSAKSPPLEEPKRVSTEPDVTSPSSEARALPGLQKETSAPSKLQQGRLPGKLADRFNPALAGMLARGPPPMATEGGRGSVDSGSGNATGGSDEPSKPGPQLTHMTKGRARGPRRKAPTASATSTNPTEPASTREPQTPKTETVKSPPLSAISTKSEERLASPKVSPSKEVLNGDSKGEEAASAPLSIQQQVAAKAALRGRASPTKSPGTSFDGTNDAEKSRPLPLRRQPTSPERQQPDPPSPIRPQKTGGDASQPGSPKKLDMKRMSKFLDDSASNPEPVREPVKLTHQRTGSRSPTKFDRPLPERPASPNKVDESAPKSPPTGPKPSPGFFSRSSGPTTPSDRPSSSSRPLPVPPKDFPAPSKDLPAPPPTESPVRSSPTKQPSEVSTLLTDFFGPQRPRRDYKVDPAEMLMSRTSEGAKIKTLGSQMFQLCDDGKKLPVPSHHERTLFEREMYIIVHEFLDEPGKKTLHTYFWVGDGVPEPASGEAQLFAQREAKSIGGKLIKLSQGKETSEFLQALGGTVVTRRGSSNKYDSLAPNMLCGRRHLGQVVFDEVDFSPASLCAGFPYLITQSGNCYLWKGKGSNVDELSCAKLVGMDLTLTGELIEYEEGSEPDSFWGMFDSKSKPYSADHWRLKPNYGKYCSRLFCSNADARQQIFEISPFSQADLSTASIYIIDAFFEIYIVVGSRAQSQFASFRNALNFAQEYAILAASIEDRPFVPVSTVVLEGAPRDMKRVFRKWSDDRSPTVVASPQQHQPQDSTSSGTGLKRGRSLRVVTLTQALQALNE